MHDTLIEQTIRPASSGKRPAGTYLINQCYLTSVIRTQAMWYADSHGTVALPKFVPFYQVVDPGTSFSLFSLPSSHGLRYTDWQTALCKDGQLPCRVIRSCRGHQVLVHAPERHPTSRCISSKSLCHSTLPKSFTLDLFPK